MSFATLIAGLSASEQNSLVRSLTDQEADSVSKDWPSWAHDGQCAPMSCPDDAEWRTWVMIAGRGYGKTRAGAEWISGMVRAALREGEALSIALVGATIDDARRVMIEGRSGLLTVAADLIAAWHPSRRLLRFAGGSEAVLFSGASPDALRGPEHHLAWCDELAKWDKPGECWDMLQLGLRLGEAPRTLVTTTPRPGAALGRIMADKNSVVSGGATYENPHLPRAFIGAVEEMYGGTRLGAQEIEGRLLSDVPGALWTMETIEACRVDSPLPPEREGAGVGASEASLSAGRSDLRASSPRAADPPPAPLCQGGGTFLMQTWPAPPRAVDQRRRVRVVIGVDPPSGDGTCGIVVCALDREGACACRP